jgi:hypothetical protein
VRGLPAENHSADLPSQNITVPEVIEAQRKTLAAVLASEGLRRAPRARKILRGSQGIARRFLRQILGPLPSKAGREPCVGYRSCFWRDGKLTCVRHVNSNSPHDRWKLEYLVGNEAVGRMEPSFHYLSASEAILERGNSAIAISF